VLIPKMTRAGCWLGSQVQPVTQKQLPYGDAHAELADVGAEVRRLEINPGLAPGVSGRFLQ
jgi:hypothetical protein